MLTLTPGWSRLLQARCLLQIMPRAGEYVSARNAIIRLFDTYPPVCSHRPAALACDPTLKWAPEHPDRRHEFVAAIIAGPSVADAAIGIEGGPGGHQDRHAAAGAFGLLAEFRVGRTPVSGLGVHRRYSSTLFPHKPNRPLPIRSLWQARDAYVKVSWRRRFCRA